MYRYHLHSHAPGFLYLVAIMDWWSRKVLAWRLSNTMDVDFCVEALGVISKLSRYEAAIERSLYRALHELQRVQAARQDGQSPPSISVDVTVDGPSSGPGCDD